MRKLLVAFLLLGGTALAQAPIRTVSVSGFAGTTLSEKITAAQAGCATLTPCNIILDAFYPTTTEVLPAVCTGCTWIDLRTALILPVVQADIITPLPNTSNVRNLTNNVATNIMDLATPVNTSTAVVLNYYTTIMASGPQIQLDAGTTVLMAINNNGTMTCGTTITGKVSQLLSTGTLTSTWTTATGTNLCTYKLNMNSSLTPTSDIFKYQVINLSNSTITRY